MLTGVAHLSAQWEELGHKPHVTDLPCQNQILPRPSEAEHKQPAMTCRPIRAMTFDSLRVGYHMATKTERRLCV